MRMKVITTITSEVNVDTFETEHSVDVNDTDGLSQVSSDVLYGLVLGGLTATRNTIFNRNPHLRAAYDRTEAQPLPEGVDESVFDDES